jgi:thiol-disulfide isomerase/thioredoxin
MEVAPSQISRDDYAVVLFHAPFCGHCRRFKPLFDEIPHVLKKLGCAAKAFEVNVEEHSSPPAWMTGGTITTVPRVVFLKDGKAKVFEGERDISVIAKEACTSGSLSGGSRGLPPKLMMWREATIKALGKFVIPKKDTPEYKRIKEVYEMMLKN